MTKLWLVLATSLAALQTISAECTNPSIRKSWTALTSSEKSSYISSNLCLMEPVQAPAASKNWGAESRWEELLVAHIAQVRYIHTVGALFPWHRWYTKIHEDLLRTECNYTGPYPYWDLQTDQANAPLLEASIFDHPSSNKSTTPAFGTPLTSSENCILTGAFANYRIRFSTQLTIQEPGSCITRALNQTAFDTVSLKNVVEPCMAVDDYADMLGCLGNAPHSGGHLAIGGIMRDHARSPVDPIFWLHHANLDRLWWEWQTANLSTRLYAMGGPNVANGQIFIDAQPSILPIEAFVPYFGDGGNVTTLDHVMWMPGLAENITVRDAMDIRGEQMCFEYV